MSNLMPFRFENQSIRVLSIENTPWFVAKDVLSALEYSDEYNPSRAIAHVPDEWKGVHRMHTPGGAQETLCLSEPGLYFFVNRSDKPKALPFQKWVAGEVLPTIRQTGGYRMQPLPTPQPETITLTKDALLALKDEMLELHRELRELHKVKMEYLEAQPRRRVLEDEEKTEILRLHAQGLPPSVIGRQVGRPTASVESFLRRVRLGQED